MVKGRVRTSGNVDGSVTTSPSRDARTGPFGDGSSYTVDMYWRRGAASGAVPGPRAHRRGGDGRRLSSHGRQPPARRGPEGAPAGRDPPQTALPPRSARGGGGAAPEHRHRVRGRRGRRIRLHRDGVRRGGEPPRAPVARDLGARGAADRQGDRAGDGARPRE